MTTRDAFELFIESVGDYGMFMLDPKGYVRTWNEGARRMEGYTADEIIGRHFSTFYPPAEIKRKKPEYELAAAEAEGRFEDEGWRVRKDGSRFWANVTITALFRNGKLIGFAEVTRDLTERRRAEEERAQLLVLERAAHEETERSLERLRALQAVTEGALSYRSQEELLDQMLERIGAALAADASVILTLGEGSLSQRAANGIDLGPQRIALGQGFIGRIAVDESPIAVSDLRTEDAPQLAGKGVRSVLGVPLRVEGRVIGVLCVFTEHERHFTHEDVVLLQLLGDRVGLALEHARLFEAEQRALRQGESAEALIADRDRLLSIAAHEIRTPVTSLNALVQLLEKRLERGQLDPEPLAQSIHLIGRQTAKLVDLIRQLLDVSRINADTMQVNRRRTDVAAFVRDVVQLSKAQSDEHPIIEDIAEELVANVDALRLEQVLTNLLDNARKFSPPGGRIEVRALRAGDGQLEISVRDHGVGIPPEHRPFIFDRFYQAHSASYRSGLGLGLSIAREIVRLHDGTLAAEFPPDGGTSFVVQIPALVSARPAQPRPQILVVDDDADIRALVAAALVDEGYDVREAANGAEALKAVTEERPGLILLDVRMPVMDGWEFARAYARTPAERAPIVAMTAATDADQRALEIGAQAAIGKPFDLASLFAVVDSILPRDRAKEPASL